ncbi:MAG: nucleotidyl transferase AbiEii/AbiGii toxin family protein [Nanoarchaeota archaeon]
MNTIPLQVKLKRGLHRRIARAQDMIVEEIYTFFPKAVLYGGTGIWRIYSGKRFSEDLDFYLDKDETKIKEFFSTLEGKGFKIIKRKISENSIYSEFELDRDLIRFEATFQKISGILCDYEMSDGNIMTVYSLSAEDFFIEKINTYLKRFKVRDLWDIFFLLRKITNLDIKLLDKFIKTYQQPIDETDLKSIILEGIVPSSDEMFNYIKQRWEKQNT